MFGLLNTTQIYGIQQQQHPEHESQFQLNSPLATPTTTPTNTSSQTLQHPKQQQQQNQPQRRTHSSVSDNGNRFFASLASKNPTNFIEKFLKTDLLSTYDNIKNYRNYPNNIQHNSSTNNNNKHNTDPLYSENSSKLSSTFNCLHGSYRHSFDGEFYDRVKVNNSNNISSHQHNKDSFNQDLPKTAEMTIKCSKNLLAVDPVEQGPATLQNYQKIPESEHDLLVDSLVASSGASSGEFNSSSDGTTTTTTGNTSSNSISSSLSSSNLYKRLSFGGRNSQNSQQQQQKQEKNGECNSAQAQQQQQQDGVTTDNSITLNLSSSSIIPCLKVIDLQRSSSSTSSSGDFLSKRERKKGAMTPQPEKTPLANLLSPSSQSSGTHPSHNSTPISAEKAQRRKLLQMLSSYDQQNKFLQRELAKERRRRTEELACVVKSLLCFESKLKTDMKSVNQRLQEKDVEICRLVRQNRALSKKLTKLQDEARECARDEGVVEDGEDNEEDGGGGNKETKDLLEDCLVLEALQCNNCRKQFYDIEVTDNCTQTGVGSGSLKEGNGSRNNDDPTTEHGSSSDDTVSSSFFGARRSVRYTSKRTSGTFRDYMRSRAMNIDDPALEADINSEEYPSTISRDDSQTSYEKLNIYSRTMERMHGVKSESERDSEQSGLETSSSVTRSNSRASTKSSKSTISTATSKASDMSQNLEEDDGIFSPTQDEDFEEEMEGGGKLKIVRGRAMEAFSEASPKQIYETSTDDWYASASDQEEIHGSVGAKSYGHGAVNPVLECVNQILLQQSMESVEERSQTPKNSTTLPRRSSLSDRRNQRSSSRASDGATPNSRNGTLTRKRVHFSTKNSMVHVPRNDETEEDEEDGVSELKTTNMISNYQGMAAYIAHSPALDGSTQSERLEIFNYESIYSNEYEPIGSELNSSNLYVDMDSSNKTSNANTEITGKTNKLPPALPPKPANLLKFKKSLQQLDESPDELIEAHNTEVLVEPDYCSISEVNVGITSVQIRADIHRAPLSERDLESVIEQDNDLDAATVISEAASQKTEEIEEIFADIPKLPNVAAIIAPKSSLKQNDYLIMTPKVEPAKMGIMGLIPNATSSPNTPLTLHTSSNGNKPDRNSLKLNLTPINGILGNTLKSNKIENSILRPQISSANYQQQYKRKHMPNILQEINKRLSLPNSPLTPTTTTPKNSSSLYGKSSSETENLTSLPLQAEFDWYNLDAEYGKNSQSDLPKVNENLNTVMPTLLADIKEDGESLITTADEYNLDEEYSNELEQEDNKNSSKLYIDSESLCEAINPSSNKAKKIRKNLANFEKFIENTSLTSKPLPTKRKIYFAGPFV